jgi:kynurenine formamidase
MNKLDQFTELLKAARIVDLSPIIETGMPRWPTHPPLVIHPTMTHESDGYYCQTIFMPEHIGAHVDAPAHIHPHMMHHTIDTLQVNALVSPAKVFHMTDLNLKPGELVDLNTLEKIETTLAQRLTAGDIVLLDYGWQKYYRVGPGWHEFAENAPGLTEAAVRWLADKGVRAVGSDTIACDQALKDGRVMQKSYGHDDYWLTQGIYIMEGLVNLDKLPGCCFFIAAPLRIKWGSGSPLRPFALVFNEP